MGPPGNSTSSVRTCQKANPNREDVEIRVRWPRPATTTPDSASFVPDCVNSGGMRRGWRQRITAELAYPEDLDMGGITPIDFRAIFGYSFPVDAWDLVQDLARRHPSVEELLGRPPTRLEEDLGIHLIRTGRIHLFRQILQGVTAEPADSIAAIYHVADLVIESWGELEPNTQAQLRNELRRLLWRIRGPTVQGTWLEATRAVEQILNRRRQTYLEQRRSRSG